MRGGVYFNCGGAEANSGVEWGKGGLRGTFTIL
jgi:hypothetical protein